MQRIPINLVKPGMILAKPVTNEKGIPLCGEGTELNANLIDRLKKMNVITLTLKGHPLDLGTREKTTEEKIQDMKARFSKVQGNPIMEKLKEAIASAIASDGCEQKTAQETNPHE